MKTTTVPQDGEEMGLTPNTIYDRSHLKFVGWANEAGRIESPDGYQSDHYWDDDSRYLGPDCDGIIPIYEFVV